MVRDAASKTEVDRAARNARRRDGAVVNDDVGIGDRGDAGQRGDVVQRCNLDAVGRVMPVRVEPDFTLAGRRVEDKDVKVPRDIAAASGSRVSLDLSCRLSGTDNNDLIVIIGVADVGNACFRSQVKGVKCCASRGCRRVSEDKPSRHRATEETDLVDVIRVVGDRVGAAIGSQPELVDAGATSDAVIAALPDQEVVTATAEQRVVARATDQRVGLSRTSEGRGGTGIGDGKAIGTPRRTQVHCKGVAAEAGRARIGGGRRGREGRADRGVGRGPAGHDQDIAA